MALDASKVRVAITGAIYVGPTGSTAPTDATSVVDSAFTDLGYVSEDGVTESHPDDVQEIPAWQNGAIVRRVISKSDTTFQFTLIETKKGSLELYYKGSTVEVNGGGGYKMDVKPPNADPRAFVIDVIDGTKHERIYIANGEINERGDRTRSNSAASGYEVTLTAYPVDVDGESVVMTIFSDDINWTAS